MLIPVTDGRTENPMIDQPAVKLVRAPVEAKSRQNQKRSCRKERKKNPNHAESQKKTSESQKEVPHHQATDLFGQKASGESRDAALFQNRQMLFVRTVRIENKVRLLKSRAKRSSI